MADRVGQRLDNYRLVRLLGTGSFGQVYLAEHIYRNTQVAVKVLPQLADDDLPGFLNEARTIRLKHPHIIQILDFGVENHIPFIVMDYAPNGTLRKRYPKGTRLPLASIISYAKQAASALEYAHSEQLVHRDVKPENMLLGPNNEVLLSDFGIATMVHSSRSQSIQEMAGTVVYMAPEQLQGKARPASDQYALGIVVYEWLCGERPFKGSHIEIATQHMLTPPPPLREKIPGIPSAIEQVVLTALEKDPKKRFSSVQAFTNALEQAFKPQPLRPVAPISIQPPAPAPSMPAPAEKLPSAVAPLPSERLSTSMSVPPSPTSARPSATPSPASSTPNIATTTPSKSVSTPKRRLSQITGLASLVGLSLSHSKRTRGRLFYPSLALLVLMVVALVGGGIYYFVHKSQDVEQLLQRAQNRVEQAKAELTGNPGAALHQLALAQDDVREAQHTQQLNNAQRQQATTLLVTLTKEVQTAIDAYNASPMALIKVLPCDGTTPRIINEGSTSIPQSLASVHVGTTTWLYALGQDENVYLLTPGTNHYSLLSGLTLPSTVHVLFLTGNGDLLVALQTQADPKMPYSVNLYRPDATGSLKPAGSAELAATYTQDGKTPMLISASSTNLYVVLASKAAPDNALLLKYSVSNGHVSPTPTQLQVSENILSLAALPGDQLFFLLADGSIKSLQFKAPSQPLSVLTQQAIIPPLATSDQPFTPDMNVPVPVPQHPSQFLTVAGATALSAGVVNGVPHLYVSDPMNHRIIDLVALSGASPALVSATQRAETGTPTLSGTAPAPTSTTGATNVTLQLFQQDVSAASFSQLKSGSQVKSVAVDPQAMLLYVLIQNNASQSSPSSFSLISLSTGLQSHCSMQSTGP